MKRKFWFLPVLFLASACGINDLEDRLSKIEGALGTNEPFAVDFSTKDGNNEDVLNKKTYLFKTVGNDEGIWDYGNGNFYIYIERFSDVEWYESGFFGFNYNVNTKTVTDAYAGTYFTDKYGNSRSYRFYQSTTGTTLTVTVNSINTTTGKVDITVTGSTTDASSDNYYTGKPMNLSIKFKGTTRSFVGGAN